MVLPSFANEVPHSRVTDPDELDRDVDFIIQSAAPVAIDFETDSLRQDPRVAGFSYAFRAPTVNGSQLQSGDPDSSTTNGSQLIAKYVPCGHRAKGREANLPLDRVKAALRRLALAAIPTPVSEEERQAHPYSYESRGQHVVLCMWHAQFDLEVLRSFVGVDLQHPASFIDGMIRHHILWPSLPHSLKSVSADHLVTPSGLIYRAPKLDSLEYWQTVGDEADSLAEYDEENWHRSRGTKDFTRADPTDPVTVFYTCLDAHTTFRLCEQLQLAALDSIDIDGKPNVDRILEFRDKGVVGALRQMERWRVKIDLPEVERLIEHHSEQSENDLAIARDIARQWGDDKKANKDFNPESWQQIIRILHEQMGVPVKRRNKPKRDIDEVPCEGTCSDADKTRRRCKCCRNPRTDKKALAEFIHHVVAGPFIRAVLGTKKHRKVVNTYLDKLAACDADHTVRACFSPFKASGRFSAPSRGVPGAFPAHGYPKGRKTDTPLRYLFIARDGFIYLIIDFEAQEMALTAALCRDPFWLASYEQSKREGRKWDPHTEMALFLWGPPDPSLPLDEQKRIAEERRDWAKAIVFGIVYGIGDAALAEQLGITLAEARRIKRALLDRVPVFRAWDAKNREDATRYCFVRNFQGRRLHAFRRKLAADGVVESRRIKPHIATNYRIQGSGSEIMRMLLVLFHEHAERAGWNQTGDVKCLLTVHDECVFEVREELIESVLPTIKEIMLTPGQRVFAVPMSLDMKIAKTWGPAPKKNVGG